MTGLADSNPCSKLEAFVCRDPEGEWIADQHEQAHRGRCPICAGLAKKDFATVCDCWEYEREFPGDTEFWR